MVVFSTDKDYQADIIANLLAEEGIECNILNKQDSMYKIGEIDVYVAQKDYATAQEIVKKAKL